MLLAHEAREGACPPHFSAPSFIPVYRLRLCRCSVPGSACVWMMPPHTAFSRLAALAHWLCRPDAEAAGRPGSAHPYTVGHLFLPTSPALTLPIPDLRTLRDQVMTEPSVNLKMIARTEDAGILVMANSVVRANSHRKLDVGGFRSFALADEIQRLARRYKVSCLAALHRIFDAGALPEEQRWHHYHSEQERIRQLPGYLGPSAEATFSVTPSQGTPSRPADGGIAQRAERPGKARLRCINDMI